MGPYGSMALPFHQGTGRDWFPRIPLPFPPWRHQEKAFDRLLPATPRNTPVATGTGSGKTECFLLPLLEHCRLQHALATDPARPIADLIHTIPALAGLRAGLSIGAVRHPAQQLQAARPPADPAGWHQRAAPSGGGCAPQLRWRPGRCPRRARIAGRDARRRRADLRQLLRAGGLDRGRNAQPRGVLRRADGLRGGGPVRPAACPIPAAEPIAGTSRGTPLPRPKPSDTVRTVSRRKGEPCRWSQPPAAAPRLRSVSGSPWPTSCASAPWGRWSTSRSLHSC